ncbi:UNVERIFIED_CONTAM: hypothetical protein RMT77_012130 [Armadillidium vulgare]
MNNFENEKNIENFSTLSNETEKFPQNYSPKRGDSNHSTEIQQQQLQVSSSPSSSTVSLERKSSLWRSCFYIIGFLFFEISKQIINYSLSKSNDNKYPIPTSLLIILIELVKLLIISVYLQIARYKSYKMYGFSFKFMIPAVCYFMTNLMYFYALTITAPPIWILLIQTRILYTALIYKIQFGKPVTVVQFIGCLLIIVSIYLTRASQIYEGNVTIDLKLIGLSQLSAILSSTACLVVELLLKNDSRNFAEQQFWLYFWGVSLGSIAFYFHPQTSIDTLLQILQNLNLGSPGFTTILLGFSICISALAGLCVPFIVKNLDSIVKDYLVALNNILLAYLIAFIFPLDFQVNYIYGISLLILFLGIALYERKTVANIYCL